MELKKRKLYDLNAPNKSTAIINGESSNILNWDDIKFPWARKKWKTMVKNYWVAEEVNMTDDQRQWLELPERYKESFKKIIGLLAFLDSIQTDYCGHMAFYLTDSSLMHCMNVVAFQESIHNESYSYVLSSLVPYEEQLEVFDYWKTNKVMQERNEFIGQGYKAFVENPTVESFLKSCVYDVILEGLFFYSGFIFFYNLARNNKMLNTARMISFINRDEQTHVDLFASIYKETIKQYPQYKEMMDKFGTEAFAKAAELELKWAKHAVMDALDGVLESEVEGYIKYYANFRANQMGFEKPFPEITENPLKWIKQYLNFSLGKVDFFEDKVSDYEKAIDNGFDEL